MGSLLQASFIGHYYNHLESLDMGSLDKLPQYNHWYHWTILRLNNYRDFSRFSEELCVRVPWFERVTLRFEHCPVNTFLLLWQGWPLQKTAIWVKKTENKGYYLCFFSLFLRKQRVLPLFFSLFGGYGPKNRGLPNRSVLILRVLRTRPLRPTPRPASIVLPNPPKHTLWKKRLKSPPAPRGRF